MFAHLMAALLILVASNAQQQQFYHLAQGEMVLYSMRRLQTANIQIQRCLLRVLDGRGNVHW